MATNTPHTLWTIDDSHAEQALLQVVLRPLLGDIDVVPFYSGEQAIERLNSGERPSLVLLDLNMPGMGGHTFLEYCREHYSLIMPILILSSSNNPTDISRAYKGGASSYLIKPPDLNELRRFAATLVEYWMNMARLPHSVIV